MSPPSTADKPLPATAQNPSQWLFTWEAQSHTPTLRLLLFNPNRKPSSQCRDLKLKLLPEQSLLTVSFLGSEEDQIETSLAVPVPRVLVDPESPLHFKAHDDNIEIKLVLLLPVDHPIVSSFDSVLCFGENKDEFRPLFMDSDVDKLSCMKEVHFYCRNCSMKLTNGIRVFNEMPSVNWRDSADNWFGNCCCSFGGISEDLVAKYAKSYVCQPGVCLLSTTSVLLCTNDLVGCEFAEIKFKTIESDCILSNDSCFSRVSPDEVCKKIQHGCCSTHGEELPNGAVETTNIVNDESLSDSFSALLIQDNTDLTSAENNVGTCDTGCCAPDAHVTSQTVRKNGDTSELLENQKVFLDGFLGNGFMVRSSGLSKDILWKEYLCPQCSCLVGAYPCLENNVPLDGGVRLFKCYISTSSALDDAFRNYTLERMFSNQLLESAEDELSFRTIVRDITTKFPKLQIVLLNPNSWSCTGFLEHSKKPVDKLVMRPIVKLLFSACNPDIEFNLKSLEEWMRDDQVDEIYMFDSQITELCGNLGKANSLSPPSYSSLQGLHLSSMRR